MKIILPILCSLLLIGCNDQTVSQGSSTKSPEVVTPSTVVVTPPPATVNATFDPALVFGQKCASCHGAKGEKSALGKSQIIASLSGQQIKDALKGYKDGTYGKEMKGIMQGQSKSLTPEQIDALAKYIPTL